MSRGGSRRGQKFIACSGCGRSIIGPRTRCPSCTGAVCQQDCDLCNPVGEYVYGCARVLEHDGDHNCGAHMWA